MSPGLSRSLILYWNTLALVLLSLVHLRIAAAAPTGPIVHTSPDTGNTTVVDPTTQQLIPQFAATDGGAGMLNKILWATFGSLVGGPLGVGGVRAGSVATGAGVGFVGVMSRESSSRVDICRP
ncbi:hypothetical protein JB92DRAFT_2903871 [Gautieria morchelliformis]|nr:hypothetical protein JB92DRAFT_2903871 [Gautieria morchelliformis]